MLTIVHIFPYSARASGGHSNAIREFMDCQRLAGLQVWGLSPSTEECFDPPLELPAGTEELPYQDPAAVEERILRLVGAARGVVHLHSVDAFATAIAKRMSRCGIAVAMTSHGQFNVRSLGHAVAKFGYLALRDHPARYVGGIHVLTVRERKRLGFLLPAYRGRQVNIPHVIHVPADRPATRHEPPFTIVHLGRLDVRTKGLDLLLEGFAKAGVDGARLILAGPDWNGGQAKLELAAARLGCSESVSFPGAVYGGNKERLLASANLFVASSRWDAFNISLAEAMARGIPALISNRLNLAPELSDANAAEVISCSAGSIARTIRRLADDPRHLDQLSTAGRSWVQSHCHPSQVGRSFARFYMDLLADHDASGNNVRYRDATS